MHTLVIGGTTFLGRAVVDRLLAERHRVTVFTRGNRRPAWFDRIEHVAGDRDDPASLERLADRRFDAVIDNIAYGPAHVGPALDILHGATARYVFTSSAAVYAAGTGAQPAPEDDVDHDVDGVPLDLPGFPVRPPEDWRAYALGKIRAERMVLRESRVATTIVRPSIVVGPEDDHRTGDHYLRRLATGEPIALADGGRQMIHPGYVDDVAQGIVRAAERPAAAGRVYNLAQDAPLRLVDWLAHGAAALGRAPDVVTDDAAAVDDAPEPWTFRGTFVLDVGRQARELDVRTTPVAQWMATTLDALTRKDTTT